MDGFVSLDAVTRAGNVGGMENVYRCADVGFNRSVDGLRANEDRGGGVVLTKQSDNTSTVLAVTFKAWQSRFGFPRRSTRTNFGIALINFMI